MKLTDYAQPAKVQGHGPLCTQQSVVLLPDTINGADATPPAPVMQRCPHC